jgi:hypothetical protein
MTAIRKHRKMISSVDKYVGKSFKYLAIHNKTMRALVQNHRPEDGSLTVDYLVDILTPGSEEEMLSEMDSGVELPQETVDKLLAAACESAVKTINILITNYWSALTSIVAKKKKWKISSLLTEVLSHCDRVTTHIYYLLVDLSVQLHVMRTVGGHADRRIAYRDLESIIYI